MTKEFQFESLFKATSVQSGDRFRVRQHGPTRLITHAENVSSGATVLLQTSDNGTTWTTRKTRIITENGLYADVHDEPIGNTPWARARLSSRTDGEYTCYIILSGVPSAL